MKLKMNVNGQEYVVDVEVEDEAPKSLGAIVIGGGAAGAAAPAAAASGGSANAIPAPLAGSVFKINVAEGDEVKAGQVVVVLEAMKMETEITAPADGKVAKILVAKGDPVQGGQALIELA
ncbi:MAG: biotin/lipoyl-containing protein [Propionibacteriaceae bacterium]